MRFPALGRIGPSASYLPLAVGFLLFPFAGQDDKYITLWAAESLATRGDLLNHGGERLEQGSSLSFTLVLAAVRALTRAPITVLSILVSGLGAVLLVWATGRLASRLDAKLANPARLLCACFTPVLYWAFSGTEMTWAAGLYVALVDATLVYLRSGEGRGRTLSWLAAFLLVRPEAPLVFAAGLLGVFCLRPAVRRRALELAAATLLFAACVAGARLAYFGRPLPQALYGRVLELWDVRTGLGYFLREDQLISGATLVLAIALLGVKRAPDVAVFAGAVLAFLVCAGGDWMLCARLLLPALPLCIVLGLARGVPRFVLPLGLGLELFLSVWFARDLSTSIPAGTRIVFHQSESARAHARGDWLERHNRLHSRDLLMVPVLERAIESHPGVPVVRSGQAGMVVFHVASDLPGRFRFIDAACLTTRTRDGDADADFYFGLLRPPPGFVKTEVPDPECSLASDWLGLGACEVEPQIFAVRASPTQPPE